MSEGFVPTLRLTMTETTRGAAGDRAELAEEVRLAEAIARGETDAFAIFYQRYVDRLYRLIYYQLSARQADAEDVLQETMFAAVKSIGRFRGKSRLFTWLCGIAYHKITDQRRRQGAGRAEADVPLDESHHQPGGEVRDGLLQTDTRLAVRQALTSLPDQYRQVLVLKYVEGFSVDDIAVIMGRSFKGVESLLSRARDGLRAALGQEVEYGA